MSIARSPRRAPRCAPAAPCWWRSPTAGGLQARCFGRKWFHLDVPRHLFHFTKDSLTRLLTKHELVIESWRHRSPSSTCSAGCRARSMLGARRAQRPVQLPDRQADPGQPGRAEAHRYTLGSCVFPASVGATALSALLGRGGTLIASARAAR